MKFARSILFVLILATLASIGPAANGQKFETLFSDNQGGNPTASLVLGSDGNFYGTTSRDGVSDHGTVFKVSPEGKLATLASFNGTNGSYPSAKLVQGSDGSFYGTTNGGGVSKPATIFKVTPAGKLTLLASFPGTSSQNFSSGLVIGNDGNLYGTTSAGGASDSGVIFKVTPAGELTTLVSFNGTNGRHPIGGLAIGSDGNFYGVTRFGGANNAGTTYQVTPAGELTTLVSFNVTNGRYPRGGLVAGNDGNLYGTTSEGGADSAGTVFKMTPGGGLTTLVSFNGTNGRSPRAELVKGTDGNFYGTTYLGGANSKGCVFKMTPAGGLTTLFSFNGSAATNGPDGYDPAAGLVEGADGSFYGTTESGGTRSQGTVFKVAPDGAFTTLVSFNPGTVDARLATLGRDGNFYGTILSSGDDLKGRIFKVTPSGEYISLFTFETSFTNPSAVLVEGDDGNFYGTTEFGGTSSEGTVFKVTSGGELTTLASFGAPHGTRPSGGLIMGSNGHFYGMTQTGGANDGGTIFKVTPSGELTTVASFNATTGMYPHAELVIGRDGNFYGTTGSGGAHNAGTVFKLTPAGELSKIGSFNIRHFYPRSGLVEGSDGNFFGTTQTGGASDLGTVFKVTPAGEVTTVVSFNGANGNQPIGGLVEGSDGNLYGTTFAGGANDQGTIYSVSPSGEFNVLHSFDSTIAAKPQARPIFGADGKLYGTARAKVVWMLSFADGPSAAITQPTAITTTRATLNGTVNANAAETTVTFEYGLTPGYGSSITASQGSISGVGETPVSATLSGLAPHTTYYYRITATNSNGSTSTAESSFTTANTLPVGSNDTFGIDPDEIKPSTLSVLANDTDADGDVLTIVAVTQGAFGTVATNGSELTYTPAAGFRGRDTFSYTVSDGFDTATAQVELRVTVPLTRALFSKGSEVPGAGLIDSGIPAESLFKSFGVPAINSAGTLAFTANYAAPRGASEFSILVAEPRAVGSRLIARRGATASGTQGARFASFKDPLLNDASEVAFLASLSGGDTTKRNNQGIWISASNAANSGGTELVVRTGTQPPGVSTGAQWKSFTSVAFSGVASDSDEGEGGWSLAFTGFMSTGAGGVKANNDMGLWIARPGKMLLALREDQKLTIDGTEKQVRTFAALKPLPTAPGQGNGVTSSGGVSVQVFFTDGSQGMLQVSNDGGGDEIVIEVLALTGDAVMAVEETIAKPGLPAQSASGATAAWVGTLSGKPAPGAIFERSLGDSGVLRLLARKGDENTGIDGAAFSAFTTVSVNDSGSALFLGKVAGRGISSANDNGLWWRQNSGGSTSLQLLAREGAQPPGTPAGTTWSAFTSLALPEGNAGPAFTAKLAGSKGMARQDRVASSNDQGLWAVDSSGELQLVVREGQEVTVDGGTTPKKIKSFTVLSAIPGSSAQRRSFDTTGRMVYHAVFTDGSQAVVKVQLP